MSQTQKVKCGQCHYEFERGVHICQGRKGFVVYGATKHELAEARKMGGMIGGVIGFFLMLLLPILLNSQLGWKLKMGWGMEFWSLVPVAIVAFLGMFYFEKQEDVSKSGLVRTFLR